MVEITLRKIAMVGFGEAGSILGAELAATGREVVTYDILLDTEAGRAAMLDKARRARVQTADSHLLMLHAMLPGLCVPARSTWISTPAHPPPSARMRKPCRARAPIMSRRR
jgi:6-phosphogluconate dehydrogenase (decarboxylating)